MNESNHVDSGPIVSPQVEAATNSPSRSRSIHRDAVLTIEIPRMLDAPLGESPIYSTPSSEGGYERYIIIFK